MFKLLSISNKIFHKITIRIGDVMEKEKIIHALTMMRIIKKEDIIMAMEKVITETLINASFLKMELNKSLEMVKNGAIKIITKNTSITKTVKIKVHLKNLTIAKRRKNTKINKKLTENKKAITLTSYNLKKRTTKSNKKILRQ
jgi:hypothetical protein